MNVALSIGPQHTLEAYRHMQPATLPAKKTMGRPTVMTSEALSKLETAFSYAFTDEEACFYADISHATLYRYEDKNPHFRERKQALKLRPNIMAKIELVRSIEGNLAQARWWGEHWMSDEFSSKKKIEHQGKIETEQPISSTAQLALVDKFNREYREIIIAERRAQG